MQENKGVYFALITALISGFSVFLNKFAVSFWENSDVFTTAKILVASFFLVLTVFSLKKLTALKNLSKKQWFLLVAIGLIGGSAPFILFFKGLTLASASSAAFIHKTLFIWVALMAIPLLKEKISNLQFLALGIILSGVYLLKPLGIFNFGYGEFLILSATLIWAVENIIAKFALRSIPSLIVGSARMFFGSVFLLVYLALSGNIGQLFVFSGYKISWLLISGLFLSAYVVSWYAALKNASATVVSCILVAAAPITALLDFAFANPHFKGLPIFSIALIMLGVLFFTRFFEKLKIFLQRRSLLWTEC